MKNILKFSVLFIALCFLGTNLFAQDTLFYQYPRLRVASKKNCDYFSLLTKDSVSNNIQEIRYNKEGKEIEEQHYYISGRDKVKFGTWKEWSPEGYLISTIQYNDSKKNGLLKTFWPDGMLKRADTFLNDSCVGGVCYNRQGKEIPHFAYHIPPQFPGGTSKLFDFLKRKIYYPQTYNMESGKVVVRFMVEKDGTIDDIELLTNAVKDQEDYMGKQVIHAVKKMPAWIPGRTDGEPDAEYVLLPVTFSRN